MSKPGEIERAELWISQILRWGVVLCAAVISVGWLTSSNSTIMIGLLMLILLPIVRVFAAGVIFLKQKDFIYVGLSFFVLTVLLTSLLLGKQL